MAARRRPSRMDIGALRCAAAHADRFGVRRHNRSYHFLGSVDLWSISAVEQVSKDSQFASQDINDPVTPIRSQHLGEHRVAGFDHATHLTRPQHDASTSSRINTSSVTFLAVPQVIQDDSKITLPALKPCSFRALRRSTCHHLFQHPSQNCDSLLVKDLVGAQTSYCDYRVP